MIDRFQALNRERIARLGSLLPVKHQNLLHFLPLLFQLNSNNLPGYVNFETPVGIVDYQPNKQALDAAKSHHKAFLYTRRALHRYPIRAIYLINKEGILSYNSNEALQLWLIYAQPLSDAQQTLLTQKSAAISSWLQAEGIPFEIRLFDEAELRADKLSGNDLDIFYCSSLLLAGNAPSWWSEESEEHAQENALRYAKESIDFGAISPLSEQALFDLVFANIEKSLDQGVESCLDLLYFDCLLKQHPSTESLSQFLKQAIINGETDPMLLDITILKYKLLSQYLTEPTLLSLAQQSLYLRGKESLSKNIEQVPYPWRRKFLKDQIEEWHWQDTVAKQLDQQWQLHYRGSLPLFQMVREKLAGSIAKLSAFSKKHQLKTSQHQRQLEKKFEVLFNEQADTIKQLPLALSARQAEEYAYLYRKKQTHNWCIDDQPLALSKIPLYQHSSLLNVLAWAINNQLISKATRLKIADENHAIKSNVIVELVQYLLRTALSNKPNALTLEQIKQPAEIDHVLLFANIDHESNDSLSQHGLEISSLRGDPFNYANKKQNLVANIEGLIHSNWNQWHYVSFTGNDCLLQMLTAILHWHPTQHSAVTASCWCHYGNHGQSISNRIQSIYHQVLSRFITAPDNGEYIVSLGGILYQLKWQNSSCDSLALPKNTSVLQHLAKSRMEFYPSVIDSMLDEDSLLSTILNYQTPDQISLFILTIDSTLTIFILDNLGSLFQQQFSNLTQNTLTYHFHEFLTAIPDIGKKYPQRFFQISKHYKSEYKVTEFHLKQTATKLDYLPVTIAMEAPKENAQCTINCGSKKFSGAANEPDLFLHVRDLILSLRKSNNNYHLYITQLSFKQSNIPIRDYLIQKQRLEYLLNKF